MTSFIQFSQIRALRTATPEQHAQTLFVRFLGPKAVTSDGFDYKRSSFNLNNGERMDLPSRVDEEDWQKIYNNFQPRPRPDQMELSVQTYEFTNALFAQAGRGKSAAHTTDFQESTHSFVKKVSKFGNYRNGADLAQQSILFAMGGLEGRLQEYAMNVHNRVQLGNEIRTDLSEIKQMINDDKWPQEFTYYVVDKDGKVSQKTEIINSKTDAESLANTIDTQLKNLRDVTELEQQDLQQLLQRYQETMQMLSNIIALFDKTADSIVSNLRG